MREAPAGEVSKNAILLERGGFVYKTMAGVYDYLPLGFRVLEKVKNLIREEMNAIGGQEMFMTSLQPKERWEKTGRWEELGKEVMYQFQDHSGREIGLAVTHEEALSEIAMHSIYSYQDLPLFIYQIQTKFRDELRAKSGLVRGRELLMKDMYSFHRDTEDFERFYFGSIDKAYKKIFKSCNLNAYLTKAAGGSFTRDYTHEYQVFAETGEDHVFYCEKCGNAENKEISKMKEGGQCRECGGEIKSAKSIEVGNIFPLGTKYSASIGLLYSDEQGAKRPVIMGSYGIGVSRLIATIVETNYDDKGIVWPESVSPFTVHLVSLGVDARTIYEQLRKAGIETLYDDREHKTAGEKFADSDLIGIRRRMVVSAKTKEKSAVELKSRNSDEVQVVSLEEAIKICKE